MSYQPDGNWNEPDYAIFEDGCTIIRIGSTLVFSAANQAPRYRTFHRAAIAKNWLKMRCDAFKTVDKFILR